MPGLSEIQALMHRVLRRELGVEAAAAELGVSPKRLAIYRDFVKQHVDGAMAKIYPRTRRLLGEPRYVALRDAYFDAHPPASWELNAATEGFYAFLDAEIIAGSQPISPFLVALAQVEWEEFAVYMHPASVPAPSTLERPIVNPTLTAIAFGYAVVPFMVRYPDAAELSPDTPLPERASTPQITLLFRRAETFRVAYYHGGDDLRFAIEVVHEGIEPEAAAAASGQPLAAVHEVLDRAAEIGLILRPS